MGPRPCFLSDGRPATLLRELASGGEGVIYAIAELPDMLAKVYHPGRLSPDQHSKLKAMLQHAPKDPMAVMGRCSIAWPRQLLFADPHLRQCVGFVMQRAEAGARPIHQFFQPESRREHTPQFDLRYLATAGRNLASAVSAIHAVGHCLGDMNESNVLVTPEALVTLIDTDSFQIRLQPSTLYRCGVGKPEYLARELAGRSFENTPRTPATDNFALSVLLFQLLMQGFHPFSGVPPAGKGEPPPISERIAQGLYVYDRVSGYRPPKKAPPLDLLPGPLQDAFRRSFVRNPDQRPLADDWVRLLDDLVKRLTECPQNSLHLYPSHRRSCPWCEVAARGDGDYFPSMKGLQVRLSPPGARSSTKERERFLLSHIHLALADGYLSPERERTLQRLAAELGMERELPKLLEAELRRTGAKRTSPQGAAAEPAKLELTQGDLDFSQVQPRSGKRRLTLGYSNSGRGALRGHVRVEPPGPFSVSPEHISHNQGQLSVTLDTDQLEWDRGYGARLVVEYNGITAGAQETVTLRARAAPHSQVQDWIARQTRLGQRCLFWAAWPLGYVALTGSQDPARLLTQRFVEGLGFLPGVPDPDRVWHTLAGLGALGWTLWFLNNGRPFSLTRLHKNRSWWAIVGAFTFAYQVITDVLFGAVTREPSFLVSLSSALLTAGLPILLHAYLSRLASRSLRGWVLRGRWHHRFGAQAVLWAPALGVALAFSTLIRLDREPKGILAEPAWNPAQYSMAYTGPLAQEFQVIWPDGARVRTRKDCNALPEPPETLPAGTRVVLMDPKQNQPGEPPDACAPAGWSRIRQGWVPSDTIGLAR